MHSRSSRSTQSDEPNTIPQRHLALTASGFPHQHCQAKQRTKTRRSSLRLPRWLFLFILGLAAVEILWLIAANFLLRPQGWVFEWVNVKPEKIRMEWSDARSYWPGDLRVTGFRIRGNLLTTQWALALDNSSAQVSLPALFDKRFSARGLKSDGAVFHFRRLPRPTATLAKEDVVAPIPWTDYTPRPTDEEVKAFLTAQIRPPLKKMWGVNLAGVEAQNVREIWIDEFRFQGSAAAHGSFSIRPRERLNVDPSEIELRKGTITLGADQVLEVQTGRIRVGFPDVNTVVLRGKAILQKLEATFNLQGESPDLQFVNFYLGQLPPLELCGTPGKFSLEWRATHGVLTGKFGFHSDDICMDYHNVSLRGVLSVDGKIKQWTLGRGDVDLSGTTAGLENARAIAAGETRPLADAWSGRLNFDQARLKLGENRELSANLSGSVLDSRPLLELFHGHKDLPWLVKSTLSDRDLEARASVWIGSGRAELRSLEVAGDKLRARARMKLARDLPPQGILYLKRGLLSVGLEAGGSRTVKLINAKEWFEQHPLLRPDPSMPARDSE